MNKILICSSDQGQLQWTMGMMRLQGYRQEGYETKVVRTRQSAKGYVLIRDDAEAVIFKLTRL